jgi:uncharacterized protein (DUF2126 family)
MSIKAALHHRTAYTYDRPVNLGPQVIRLRPAPHCRTPIESYSLRVSPSGHFINWQQDPHGNFLARIIFEEKVEHFSVDIDLVANLSIVNPFDFFVESAAEQFPFEYSAEDQEELKAYLKTTEAGPALQEFLGTVDRDHERTIDFLVALNQRVQQRVDYVVRMEPGVQTCEETLTRGTGSCRDSAWMLVQTLRHQGLAARFTSGYLIQLKPDVKSLDGPSGTEVDFTDLHAWTEVFLPGAGWIGLDPTSGLFTGEGHIPLASTPNFSGAAPITGATDECETTFDFDMSVQRVHEDPRVTKPYTDQQWAAIDALGVKVDQDLQQGDVRLTMGGEPTFVSIDSPDDPQWQTVALGEEKNRLSNELLSRMRQRLSDGALLHFGQGKWYPGEPLPRWSKTCYWRHDGQPIWKRQDLLAAPGDANGHSADDARQFASLVARRLGVAEEHVTDAYEDVLYHLWQEQRLPTNVDLSDASLADDIDRNRLARILEQGLGKPAGCILPLQFQTWHATPRWESGPWETRTDKVYLLPGDSPMGLRLPLQTLSRGEAAQELDKNYLPQDPSQPRSELVSPADVRYRIQARSMAVGGPDAGQTNNAAGQIAGDGQTDSAGNELAWQDYDVVLKKQAQQVASAAAHRFEDGQDETSQPAGQRRPEDAIPFAFCVEARGETLHVFMPPTEKVEQYLEVLAAVEDTAADLETPVIIEGYKPPTDHRLKHFSITPDPGVIEVNVQPAKDWAELKSITENLYEDAYHSRLGTEKFELDGQQSGTGGGNHIVLGGPTPMDSPLLRRPDLLRSLVGFWQNHPSLSYLFSGKFIGPTSQAPRVDEGRSDALYELQIAFDELDRQTDRPPWLVDRIFRNLLIDVTGNTHRAEFCIDKLYSPDSSTGRLGLLEFRGFEMPPHHQMSLTQQMLLRTLVAKFWDEPYTQPLVDWKNRLHDQFMLPHFIWRDFQDVAASCQASGYQVDADWFKPHFEFRFPKIGEFAHNTINVELRQAIEPWNVLGEETSSTGTSRYVDSSVERLQVLVNGYVDERYEFICNGRVIPLHRTEVAGQYAAGVRYRAWQPPSCLHPTIGVDEPLTFDLYDRWLNRSVDGCRYHVGHPGGLNPATFPVNSFEAEGRRASRFSKVVHNGGSIEPRPVEINKEFPMTLDLRKDRR